MKKTLKWFTLIEMLIVIVIIGILAAVLLPKIGWARDKANDVAVTANVKNLGTALIQYEMDNGWYPSSLANLVTGDLIEKYWITTKYDDAIDGDKYQYASESNPNHFIVCGKYSPDNNAWNSDGDLTWWTYDYDLSGTWNWFCYKG